MVQNITLEEMVRDFVRNKYNPNEQTTDEYDILKQEMQEMKSNMIDLQRENEKLNDKKRQMVKQNIVTSESLW